MPWSLRFPSPSPPTAFSVSAKIYKWVDEDGQVNYGQQPPTGVEAEAVSVHAAPPSAKSGGSSSNDGGGSRSTATQQPQEDSEDTSASNEDAITENCRIARQNLSTLETAGPGGRFRTADDEVTRYTEEQ